MLDKYTLSTLGREIFFICGSVVFVLPVLLLVNLSLKSKDELLNSPLALTRQPHWENYSSAWTSAGNGLGPAMLVSILITVGSVLALLALGTGLAYVLARHTSKLGKLTYVLVVSSLLLPMQLGTVPLYAEMRRLELVGNPLGLIVVYTGQLMPFTVFLITGFIRKVPVAYEQAAEVDGASRLRTLIWVVVPLLRPVLGTVAVLNALIIWNDFFLPLLWFGGADRQTLPVALYSFVGASGFETPWNTVFASIVIIVTPIILFYVIAQKYLMRGFASGVRG